jgi:transposase-like protein
MIAIFDFSPKFCPNCGSDIEKRERYSIQDYNSKASFYCMDCKLQYQLATRSHILIAAKESGGDLMQYC